MQDGPLYLLSKITNVRGFHSIRKEGQTEERKDEVNKGRRARKRGREKGEEGRTKKGGTVCVVEAKQKKVGGSNEGVK
jgi:hypothetical protein